MLTTNSLCLEGGLHPVCLQEARRHGCVDRCGPGLWLDIACRPFCWPLYYDFADVCDSPLCLFLQDPVGIQTAPVPLHGGPGISGQSTFVKL